MEISFFQRNEYTFDSSYYFCEFKIYPFKRWLNRPYFFHHSSNHRFSYTQDRSVWKGKKKEMKKNRGQNIFLYPRRPFSRSHFSPTGPFSSAPFTPISASYLFNPSLRAFQPPLLSNPTTRLSPPCLFPFRVDNRLVRVNASVEWQHRGGEGVVKTHYEIKRDDRI